MTLSQTRQLGIEFERRVYTMIPDAEFANKLDTETIYSYINQYLDKLIHDLYRSIDQIPMSNNESYIETLLNSLIKTTPLDLDKVDYTFKSHLPNDFGLYIKSYSEVDSSYRYKTKDLKKGAGVLPNELISLKDVNKAISRPQDSMRIVRNPLVWLIGEKGLGSFYDLYTEPKSIYLEYYRIPNHINLITSQSCELPIEMFEQLVSGAVDLYVQYVSGAEARKRQQAEQLRQQLKRNNDNE